MLDEIIVAFATPVGSSGLQVLRVAGPGSAELVDKIFNFGPLPDFNKKRAIRSERRIAKLKGYQAAFGYLHDINDINKPLDQVVITKFVKGKSYTGEEQVEISLHGGAALRKETLDLVLRAGARLAEAGEFTKWAFINGKMDLSQAEAVMGIIEADTYRQHQAALRHLQGETAEKLQGVKERVYELLSALEVDIEYPEYEDFALQEELINSNIDFVLETLDKVVKSNKKGEVLREGLQLVLVGEPNVGKSSILNALSGEDRAIVTDIAGTTRDSIELKIDLGGIPLTLYDTAGIRETEDPIERLGVERSKELLNKADLLFLVLTPKTKSDLEDEIDKFLRLSAGDRDYYIVLNKLDISGDYYSNLDSWKYLKKLKEEDKHFKGYLSVSASTGEAIEDLKDLVINYYENLSGSGANDLVLTSKRQQHLIESAFEVFKTIDQDRSILPNDILAAALRQGLELLSEITGENVSENMLDDIFSRFCIGK